MYKVSRNLRYSYRATDTVRLENVETEQEENLSVIDVMRLIDTNQLEGLKYHISVPYRGYQTIRFEKIL